MVSTIFSVPSLSTNASKESETEKRSIVEAEGREQKYRSEI